MRIFALIAPVVVLPLLLDAQAGVRITEAIDNRVIASIPNSTFPLAVPAYDAGRVDAALPMERMLLVLKMSKDQEAGLDRLLDAQQDNASATYHRWLTPEQFATQFGAAQADVDRITGWLRQKGFTIGSVARSRQWIEFSGSAGQVENAFHTEMHNYTVNGQQHVANSKDISLPRALMPVVSGVLSLHNFEKRPLHSTPANVYLDHKTGRLVSNLTTATNGGSHYVSPGDAARIYHTNPLLAENITGNDVAIAIVARTDINLSDVQTFREAFRLPKNDPDFIINGLDPGNLQGPDEVEGDLDAEWSGAAAPEATIKFVTSGSTFPTDGVDLSIAYIIDKVLAPIMSVSFGQCEAYLGTAGNAFFNEMFKQAAAEGISVFVASGDSGPAACDPAVDPQPAAHGPNVSGIASTPFDTAVGGTQFNENGLAGDYWLANNRPDFSSAVGYIPERVWDESCDPNVDPNQCEGSYEYFLYASGGGPSSCVDSTIAGGLIECTAAYGKPSWQAGVGVPDDTVRDVPDLALNAAAIHDPYLICVEGSCQTTTSNGQTVLESATTVGGTSAGAPFMSGIMALVEQKNGKFQGLANYSFYKLAHGEDLSACNSSKLTNPTKQTACVFHDVTAGNNSVPGQAGYNAARGYDLATGLGTVDATNLVNGWNNIQKFATNTILAITEPAPVEHGRPVSLGVAVAPAADNGGSPSGNFALMTDTYEAVLGGTLSHGRFDGTVSDLPGGTYEVKARYGGDATFEASYSNPATVTITPEPSQTALLPEPSSLIVPGRVEFGPLGPYYFSQPVDLAINVQGESGMGSPRGTIALSEGDHFLGSAPLTYSGNATIEMDNLPPGGFLPGSHTLTVTYEGDPSFKKSTQQLSFRILPLPPFTVVQATPLSVTAGAPVQLLLSVDTPLTEAGLATLPTGTVQLFDNLNPIGKPITLQPNGLQGTGVAQASIVMTGLSVGTHLLELGYSGDSRYAPVAGAAGLFWLAQPGAAQVTVNKRTEAPVSINLQESPQKISLGKSVNYVVSVSPSADSPVKATPTGTVTLVDELGNTDAGPSTLVNGTASFVVPWYHAGNVQISAVYSGDVHYTPFSSKILTTVVAQGVPKVTLSAALSQVHEGERTSVTVTVIGDPANPNLSLPFGSVQFYDAVDGGSPQPIGIQQFLTTGNGGNPTFTEQVLLQKGINVITAQYLGGGYENPDDWAPTTSNPVTIEVEAEHPR